MVDVNIVSSLIDSWVQEVVDEMPEEYYDEEEFAWDDVHGGDLPAKLVKDS